MARYDADMRHERYVKTLKAKRTDLKVVGRFVDYTTPISLKHKKCGHTFVTRPQTALEASNFAFGCKACNRALLGKRRMTTEQEFLAKLSKKHPHLTLLGGYERLSSRVEISCAGCGTTRFSKAGSLLRQEFGCPVCFQRLGGGGYRKTPIRIDGKTFQIQGYEGIILPNLVKRHGVHGLLTGDTAPAIVYDGLDGKPHRYYPDFVIKGFNIVIEVKSTATLLGSSLLFRTMKRKAKACEDQGYSFDLVVCDNEWILDVPNNWMRMKFHELRGHFGMP